MTTHKRDNDQKALLIGLSAVLLWSTVASAFKLTLGHTDVIPLVWWSSVVSLAVLGIWTGVAGKMDEAKRYIRGNWKKAALLGVINPLIYYLTLFKAYDLLPAQEAQAINYSWALMLALLSVPMLGHKISRHDIAALLLGYGGVVLIATRGDISTLATGDLHGVGLALLSTLFWALYWILNTRSDIDTVAAMFVNFAFGVGWLTLYMIWSGVVPLISDWKGVAGSVYIGLFEMSVTFVLWGRAMKLTSKTAAVSNLIFLSPLLSLVFIHFFVGEEIYQSTIIALLMILAGVALQRKNNL